MYTSLPVEVTDVTDDGEWAEIAGRCSYATFFHSPVWHRVFAQTYPGLKVAARRFHFQDNRVAIFPMMERSHALGLLRASTSSAASCYGGWVSADALGQEHVVTMVRWVLDHCHNLTWRLNPLQPVFEVLAPYVTREDTTEMLRIGDIETEDELKHRYDHSVRKQINKGCRAGLQAAVADKWEDWESYYAIYQKRLQEWGASAVSFYPLALFRHLFEARSPNVRLWTVVKDGALIGGNLDLCQGQHCVEWHAAYDSNFFSIGVRDFLVHSIIERARRDGFTWYDFNPSDRFEGVRRFKKTFGTESIRAPMVIRRQGIYRFDAAVRLYRLVKLRHESRR